jgi:hypothetical protein
MNGRTIVPIYGVSIPDIPLDGGTVANVFTVSGGPVYLLALLLEITEAVSANACNAKWVADPTTGVDTDMCLVVDIQSAAIGTFYKISGNIASALTAAVPGTALPLGINLSTPLIIPIGTIDLNLANSNPTSGIATAHLQYAPVVPGASVQG